MERVDTLESFDSLESFVDYEPDEGFVPPSELAGAMDEDDGMVSDGFGGVPLSVVSPRQATEAGDGPSEPDPEPDETPVERVGRLFDGMPPHRVTLAGILDLCDQPTPYETIASFVRKSAGNRPTVFAAETYTRMLVDVGALEKVTEDGTPYAEVDLGPVEVERDGQRYLEVVDPPEEFWRATDAGLEAAAPYRPQDAIKRLFADKACFAPAFEQLLEMCAREGGASIGEMRSAVNGSPVLTEKGKTAQFLIDYLERSGALVYDKAWVVTEAGAAALNMLKEREG